MSMELFAQWAGVNVDTLALGAMQGWELYPYEQDGETRALAIVGGTEIHFAINPKHRHRVIAKQRTRQFLAPLLQKHGFLTTRTDGDEYHDHFLRRLGFDFTWNDGQHSHYMLCDLPFKRAVGIAN